MAKSSAALLFFMTAIAGGSLTEILKIYRDGRFPQDDFLLPASQCPGLRPQCSKFNGSVLSACWCTCDEIQGQDTGFFEPSYGCNQVSSIRHQAGMTGCWYSVFVWCKHVPSNFTPKFLSTLVLEFHDWGSVAEKYVNEWWKGKLNLCVRN